MLLGSLLLLAPAATWYRHSRSLRRAHGSGVADAAGHPGLHAPPDTARRPTLRAARSSGDARRGGRAQPHRNRRCRFDGGAVGDGGVDLMIRSFRSTVTRVARVHPARRSLYLGLYDPGKTLSRPSARRWSPRPSKLCVRCPRSMAPTRCVTSPHPSTSTRAEPLPSISTHSRAEPSISRRATRRGLGALCCRSGRHRLGTAGLSNRDPGGS